MRHALAAAAVILGVDGIVLIRALQWQGLIAVFGGGCLWWIALHLSRSAWQAKRRSAAPAPHRLQYPHPLDRRFERKGLTMVYDRERERRDDIVYAGHKKAVAAGEKRILRRTRTGELHSYPREEIGFTPGRGQAQVSTWWGMGILTAFSGLIAVFSVLIVLDPLRRGEGPLWGALLLTALSAALTFYGLGLARDEYRASQMRKRRGSPKPGSGSVDINLLELGQGR